MAASSVVRMDDPAATSEHAPLGDRDLALLELERSWWKHPGSKDATIRERLAIAPTEYYVALNRLLDHPDALAADPLLVKRLRRLREARRQQRAATRIRQEQGYWSP